jgi:hypothetical protein
LIYDSTFTPSASVATQGGNVTGSGFAGVSLAIPPIPRFSFTGGVDLRSAADDWFAGMSLVRLAGPSAEALPLDAHLLLHVGRDDEIRNESSCAAGTAACKTEKVTRFQGLAFVLSADATSLLSELVKKLIP